MPLAEKGSFFVARDEIYLTIAASESGSFLLSAPTSNFAKSNNAHKVLMFLQPKQIKLLAKGNP